MHHEGHSHGVTAGSDSSKLALALGLILGFMAVEVVIGILAQSLALLSDAAHMLTDAAAIGLSLVAIRLAARPAKGVLTFGFKRVEILAAQANGISLLVIGAFITYEAIDRLVNPLEVSAVPVLVTALAGIAVNAVVTWVLASANRESLNIEGAFQHVLTDLFAFIGTAVAALIVLLFGFNRADPLASLLVAALMFRSGVGLLKESGRIFLEAAPRGVVPENVGKALANTPDVVEVHDLHVWEVTSGFTSLSAHVLVKREVDCHAVRREMETVLHDEFGITHTTLQVDHVGNDLLTIEGTPAAK